MKDSKGTTKKAGGARRATKGGLIPSFGFSATSASLRELGARGEGNGISRRGAKRAEKGSNSVGR